MFSGFLFYFLTAFIKPSKERKYIKQKVYKISPTSMKSMKILEFVDYRNLYHEIPFSPSLIDLYKSGKTRY